MKLKATRKTRVRVVLTLSGLLAVVCLLVLSSSDEPEYQGRELSRWLNELAHSDSPVDADKPIPAREALREMGTKVIPHLLKRLRFRDSFAKRNLVRLALRAGFIDIERYTREEYLFKREGYYHATAANGFRLLGPKAVSALPDLVSLMNQGGSSGWSAAYAIAGIGPEAVRPITQALTNQNPEVRASAVFALTGLYQADSSAAVPFLTELLN